MDDDNPTVREDIGYGRVVDMPRVKPVIEKKRIKYTAKSMMKGEVTMSASIADDLIERGYAEEVDRQPGEEG